MPRFADAAVLVVLLAAPVLAAPARADDAPVVRKPLQTAEAPADAHSVQSLYVTVAPHATIARHTHPGIEMGYLVAGTATVSLAGQPDRTLAPGDSWAFPAGVPHSLVNTGDTPDQLVVTYVVEAGKPLSTPAP